MKSKFNDILPIILLIALIFDVFIHLFVKGGTSDIQSTKNEAPYKVNYAALAQSHYYASRDALIVATQEYIDSHSNKSNLTALNLVDKCKEYDVDLIFVLAQGQLESNFGTEGLAKRTNSVWNHGAFDGDSYEQISGVYKYSHPDESVEPYLKLLTTSYLVDKTELDLMENFVNIRGERYASSVNYEELLSKLYDKIKTTTNIESIQAEMRYWYIRSNH